MSISQPEDKSEIIHLNKLKDKLLDLSSHSRKIRFTISKWLTWDLSELLNSNEPELVSNFLSSLLNLVVSQGEDKINLSLDLENFLKTLSTEDSRKFQEKIIFLQKKNLAIYQEKGYKSLFVGIFFFRGYFYNNKNILRLVNAPLFLIPCDLERIKNLNLVFNSLKKINYNLLYFFQKELNIPKSKFTDFLKKIEKDNKEIDKWEDYLIFLNNFFQELLSFSNIKIGFSPTISSLLEEKLSSTEINKELVFDPFSETNLKTSESNINKFVSAEPFVKLTLSKKPQNYQKNHLEIILNFCLTVDSETNLSLVHDFEQIIREYSENNIVHWSKSALSLLRGETESVLTYHEKKEVDKQTEILYNPFLSDPSQNRILRTIFQNFAENTLCIDGPPGTGKSQLICNLLANSLFYRKKVLVVCEKEVALRVIYDKLASLGLKHSMIKINELNQTSQVYQQILSFIESNQKEEEKRDVSSISEQISKLEEKHKSNLKKIEDYYKVEKEFYDNYRISLREVYIKFERKNLTSEIIQLSKWINSQEELDKLKIQLENYISKFTKVFTKWKPICLRLKGLFLKGDYQEIKFDLENRNDLQEAISAILKELNGEKTKVNLLSQILRINLWQKYSKSYPWITLLGTKIDDLKRLQTEQRYQKLFAFLEIRDFSDFWQKFNDKEFLFSIQRFISEEFLIIGDLPDFEEKYQQHLNYFLKKILVNQELNYFDSYEKITEQAVYFIE